MDDITRSIGEDGKPSGEYYHALKTLADKFLEDKCVLFLGAGAAVDDKKPSLPTAGELSNYLAKELDLECPEFVTLSTVAYFFESLRDREQLNRILVEKIKNDNIEPSTTILNLIDIISLLEQENKQTLVFTTNYDKLFEKAYMDRFHKNPEVVVYKGGVDYSKREVNLFDNIDGEPKYWEPSKLTCLFKLHGCIEKPGDHNLVVTEEDYVNFMVNSLIEEQARYRCLPFHVKKKFRESTILFIGYSLADMNFRVIFKATAEQTRLRKHYAVQFWDKKQEHTPFENNQWNGMVKFWFKKDVRTINAKAEQFSKDLFTMVSEIIPEG